jgi:hypothetical protein
LVVTEARRREVVALFADAAGWAQARTDVRAVGVVGSWARGAERMDSDVDLVVVVDDVCPYVSREDWVAGLGGGAVIRTRQWGELCTERRVRRDSGLEIEVDFVPCAWAATGPVDHGTRTVIAAGLRVIYDPDGILGDLWSACVGSG